MIRWTLLLLVAVAPACRPTHAGSPQTATLGSAEVTARLVEIRGEPPPNNLYDYVYVMRYEVLKTHRGQVAGTSILVGHYDPLKPRATAQDKFSGPVCGTVTRFRAGDVHRLALGEPLDQIYMGGVIDKHFGEKGTRYWAYCADKAD
jgi:hypothetical protein